MCLDAERNIPGPANLLGSSVATLLGAWGGATSAGTKRRSSEEGHTPRGPEDRRDRERRIAALLLAREQWRWGAKKVVLKVGRWYLN